MFLKKSFSLLEIVFTIFIISIITTFFVIKSQNSLEFSKKVKIKSDIALIKDSINKKFAKTILLDSNKQIILDNALINKENEKLFSNIIEKPFFSTDNYIKELSKWIKLSDDRYAVYIDKNSRLEFMFKDNRFECKNEIKICKEYE